MKSIEFFDVKTGRIFEISWSDDLDIQVGFVDENEADGLLAVVE